MLPLLLAVAVADQPATDMRAQFEAGKLLCTNPDPQSKTCSTIDRLVVRDDGTMQDVGETLIAPDQPLTLEMTSVAHFKAGAICGIMEMADLQQGIVRANGAPLPSDRNAKVLELLKKVFEPLAGQEVCEGLQVDNGRLIKVGQVERMDLPVPGKPVSWVGADEGYRVAPRSPQS